MSRAAAEVGSTANSYQILSRLAIGGMAEIFLARGEGVAGVERYCVLKRILRDRASDAQFVRMFLDEARLAAQLQHPNIAQVYDIGKLGDSYFFTMEYVHGETVRTLLHRAQSLGRALPIPCVLTIVAGAAAGLHHAHVRVGIDGRALGIVHRDVSPSNLMVSYEGSVKLVDFGVAKAADRAQETKSGTVKGKISYLSPEQCHGRRVDRRSDLFSLGICLWEMLTTERLYRRSTDFENMSAIVSEPPPPPSSRRPDVPRELDELVLQLLAKQPEQRLQTADEVVDALELVAARTGSMLSGSGLGRFIRELFGHRPEPWLELETLNETGDPITETSEPVPGELASAPADPIDRQLAGVADRRPRSATQSLDDELPAPEAATPSRTPALGSATRSLRAATQSLGSATQSLDSATQSLDSATQSLDDELPAPEAATPSRTPVLRAATTAGPTQLGFDASPGAETPPRVTRPLTAPPVPDLAPAGSTMGSATTVLPSGPAVASVAAPPQRAVPPAVETFTGSSGRVVMQVPVTPWTAHGAGTAALPGLERAAPSPSRGDLPTGSPGPPATPGSLTSDTLTLSTGQLVISASHAVTELDPVAPSSGQKALAAPAAASQPAAASPRSALVPPDAAQRMSGTLLGLGPSSAQPISLARTPRSHSAASGASAKLPGLPEPRRRGRAARVRLRWPLYAMIVGAALAGSIAMMLVMRRSSEPTARAPAPPLAVRGAAQGGAPEPERGDAVLPASSGASSTAKLAAPPPSAGAMGAAGDSSPPSWIAAAAPSHASEPARKGPVAVPLGASGSSAAKLVAPPSAGSPDTASERARALVGMTGAANERAPAAVGGTSSPGAAPGTRARALVGMTGAANERAPAPVGGTSSPDAAPGTRARAAVGMTSSPGAAPGTRGRAAVGMTSSPGMAPGARAPAPGEAKPEALAVAPPASAARAPAPRDAPADDLSRLYAAGRFDQVVTQCSAGPVQVDVAATCFLAACRMRNEAATRRMLLAVPAARRGSLASSCLQLGVDARRVDCEADPMACPH